MGTWKSKKMRHCTLAKINLFPPYEARICKRVKVTTVDKCREKEKGDGSLDCSSSSRVRKENSGGGLGVPYTSEHAQTSNAKVVGKRPACEYLSCVWQNLSFPDHPPLSPPPRPFLLPSPFPLRRAQRVSFFCVSA